MKYSTILFFIFGAFQCTGQLNFPKSKFPISSDGGFVKKDLNVVYHVVDSVLYYGATDSVLSSNAVLFNRYSYTDNGLIDSFQSELINGDDMITNNSYHYNEQGLLQETVTIGYVPNHNEKTDYNYLGLNQDSVTFYDWDIINSVWFPLYYNKYYVESDTLITMKQFYFDFSLDSSKYESRYVYSDHFDYRIDYYTRDSVNGVIGISGRDFRNFYEDGNLANSVVQYYYNGDWHFNDSTYFYYDALGNIDYTVQRYLPGDRFRNDYVYDYNFSEDECLFPEFLDVDHSGNVPFSKLRNPLLYVNAFIQSVGWNEAWVGQYLFYYSDRNVNSVDEVLANPRIFVYPNPTFDELSFVGLEDQSNLILRVMNIAGQNVLTKKLASGSSPVNVDFLPQGYYTFLIQSSSGNTSGRFEVFRN